MDLGAAGRPSYAVSIEPGVTGGPARVRKSGVDERSAGLLGHERAAIGQLSHPNIVELAAGRADGDPTLVTYLAGRATLADQPPTDAASAARVAAQLATTLADLHDLGWAHGAIAPEHCIVAPGGSIVWCSFRRASRVGRVDDPAALADVTALASMVAAFLPAVGTTGGPARRLWTLVDEARHRPPTARRLAADLVGLVDGPSPRARRRRGAPASSANRAGRGRTGREREGRGRHAAPRAPRAPRSPRSLIGGVIARLLVCLVALAALWLLGRTAAPVGSGDRVAPGVRIVEEAARWVALVAAVYGAVVNGTTLVALVSRSRRLAAAAGRLGPRWLRRWATGITSIGVLGAAVSSLTTPAPRAATTLVEAPPRALDHAPTTPPDPTTADPTATTTTTTTTAPVPTTTTAPPATPTLAATPATSAPTTTPAGATTWTTAPGDDLWHIASRTLAAARNRPPTNLEVGRYWQQLLVANRDRLHDPDDPDLIFAGQVFDLPPTDAV